jgi:hypothetical protein
VLRRTDFLLLDENWRVVYAYPTEEEHFRWLSNYLTFLDKLRDNITRNGPAATTHVNDSSMMTRLLRDKLLDLDSVLTR